MRILVYSPAFHPSVGGLEAVVETLATEWSGLGEEVTVVTTTPADDDDAGGGADPGRPFPFRVVRRPGPLELLRLVRRSDVFFQANVSLKGLWPLLVVHRPWVVSHHSWYCQADGRITWRDRLKRRLLHRAAASVAVSRAMAADLEAPTVVVANPYRDDLFRLLPHVPRDRELVFVGRLVSDKGCDLLVEALGRLAGRGVHPRLTVVGDGPERPRLRAQVERLGLAGQVGFTGVLHGEALVETLNRHRLLVAPSRYHEPFGLVALEGLACGCAIVGSAGGGLPEAIGPGGWTFPNGDVEALSATLAAALGGELPAPDPAAVARHLDRHTRRRVAARYLELLAGVVVAVNRRRGDTGTPSP